MTQPRHRRIRHVVVAICAALLVAACGDAATSDPVDVEQPNAAPAADPSPAASVSDDGPTGETPSAGPSAAALAASGLEGATLYGITGRSTGTVGGSEGLVAVGAVDGQAAAWTSEDGTTWQAASISTDRREEQFRAVAMAPNLMVAVAGSDEEASTVWTSVDGTSWSPIEASGIEARLNGLVFANEKFFAVGDLIAGDLPAEGGEAVTGVIYSSLGGWKWKFTTNKFRTSEATYSDIARRGDTVTVSSFDPDGGVMWVDVPGRQWKSITKGFGSATIQGVASRYRGFVALGRRIHDLQPFAWTSDDGFKWTRKKLDPEVFRPDDQIHDMTSVRAKLIAVGASPEGGVVWTSSDGLTWTRGP